MIYPKFLTHPKNHQLVTPRGEVMSDFIRGNKYKHRVTCVSHPTYTKKLDKASCLTTRRAEIQNPGGDGGAP